MTTASTTPSFDAAVGGDVSALNATIASVFGVLHDGIFPKTFSVNTDGVTDVTLDLLQAPTVTLAPTQAFKDEAQKFVTSTLKAEQRSGALQTLLNGSITVACGSLSAIVGSTNGPTKATGTAQFGAAVNVSKAATGSGWLLQAALSDPQIVVPNEPILSSLLTKVVAPFLLNYLNDGVLSAIQIPSLSLLGVDFQIPIIHQESPSAGEDLLVVYSGLNPVVTPPSGTKWPAGTLFVAVDSNALSTVATNFIPKLNGNWESEPFEAWYQVTVAPTINLAPGSGNQVGVTADVSAQAGFTFRTPNGLPNIHFGGSVSGSASGGARISAAPDKDAQDIVLTIDQLGNFDLNMSIDGIPDFSCSSLDR